MSENIFLSKKIILGVTASIAAYKAANIASLLVKKGAEVYPVMTKNATNFLGPLTLSSITGNKVIYKQFKNRERIYHISLPHSADLMLIAPSTADTISKIANGICDDFLTTAAISMRSPVIIAPAMNESMYLDKIFQDNIEKLSRSGKYFFVSPIKGRLACGEEGLGKLAGEESIIRYCSKYLSFKDDLEGKKILVTSGGTRENIDNVRYITNRSSGKMGKAIAEEAYFRGASKIYYITTVKEEILPSGIDKIIVDSADQMMDETMKIYNDIDIVIMTAAVSDIKPKIQYKHKLRKSNDIISKLNFELNVNILESLSSIKKRQFLVGFAAEDDIDIEKINKKFADKKVDMTVINDISRNDIGFESDYNEVIILRDKKVLTKIAKSSKRMIARKLFDEIIKTISID